MRRVLSRLRWLADRVAVVRRTAQKVGWRVAVQLVFIRLLGRSESEYSLRIPGYTFPVTIRGGQSTDAYVIYESMVLDEYVFVGDLDSPALIIDGGANIGIASLYFLMRYPTAHIVAVEPSPRNFEVCCKNLLPYGQRVTLIQGAVWKEAGWLDLDEASGEDWRTRVRPGNHETPGTVQAFTIQSLIPDGYGTVDLLKVDIEGAERELFGPSAQDWLPAVRNIVIELHDQHCSDRFFGAMTGYEFDLVRSQKQVLPIMACLDIRRTNRAAGHSGTQISSGIRSERRPTEA